MKIFITCLFTILSTQTFASLSNESELGILIAKGNSDSQNLNAKEIVGWSLDELNLVKFNGRYLQTKNNNIENARFWSAGFRYDRLLNSMFGIFLGEIVN